MENTFGQVLLYITISIVVAILIVLGAYYLVKAVVLAYYEGKLFYNKKMKETNNVNESDESH